MFVRGERLIDPHAQAIMLCMYTPDLITFREQILAAGINVPPVVHPEELDFPDSDGIYIAVMHWGKAEQEVWEKRLAENK